MKSIKVNIPDDLHARLQRIIDLEPYKGHQTRLVLKGLRWVVKQEELRIEKEDAEDVS